MPRAGVSERQVLKAFKQLKSSGGTNAQLAEMVGLSPASLSTKLAGIRLGIRNATAMWKVGEGDTAVEMTGAAYAEKFGINVKDMASELAVANHNESHGSKLAIPTLVTPGVELGSLSKSRSASKYTDFAKFAQGLIDSIDEVSDEDESEETAAE